MTWTIFIDTCSMGTKKPQQPQVCQKENNPRLNMQERARKKEEEKSRDGGRQGRGRERRKEGGRLEERKR